MNLFYDEIRRIIEEARQKAYSAVNFAMVEAYWHIGKRIVEKEQGGNRRAGYGKGLMASLARKLTNEFGKGFSESNIKNFRQFYLSFSETGKRYALRSELTVKNNEKDEIKNPVSCLNM